MNRVSSFVAVLGSLVLLGGAAQAQPAAQPTSDAQISDQVIAALHRVDPSLILHLEVTTKDGVVTLSGETRSARDAMKALQAAGQVPGVTKVRNRLSSAR